MTRELQKTKTRWYKFTVCLFAHGRAPCLTNRNRLISTLVVGTLSLLERIGLVCINGKRRVYVVRGSLIA
jgi:hypothetical protein